MTIIFLLYKKASILSIEFSEEMRVPRWKGGLEGIYDAFPIQTLHNGFSMMK
jgi:hypothetical protein